jgi:hypothetical protein
MGALSPTSTEVGLVLGDCIAHQRNQPTRAEGLGEVSRGSRFFCLFRPSGSGLLQAWLVDRRGWHWSTV